MQPESRRRPGAVAIVASTLLAVASLTLFAAGGVLLWADGQKDDQGYLNTSSERFSTRTAALATQNLDVDLDGLSSAVGDGTLGHVRLDVQPGGAEPVFAGIARTQDVDNYLRGTAHTIVRDVDTDPFRADYSDRPGDRRIAPPVDDATQIDSPAGAKLPILVPAGWTLIGGGALALLIAGGVLYLSARRPAQPRPEEPNPLTPRSVASS